MEIGVYFSLVISIKGQYDIAVLDARVLIAGQTA